MTIKEDIKSMFWESAIDYANAVEGITFETDAEIQAQQERWDKIHKAYGRGVEDVMDFILSNYKLEKILPIKEETEEEIRIRLRDSYEYHDMCARATIHPGKTIDDVKQIHLNKRIEDTYKFINEILCNTTPMNTPETRKYVTELIQKRLDHQAVIKCNEANNPSDVIDSNVLVAQLYFNTAYSETPQIRETMLVFGDELHVAVFHRQLIIDNETIKFIQKGI